MDEQVYKNILATVADSSMQLRPTDVVRVLEEAHKEGKFRSFKTWILKQDLKPRTREILDTFHEADFE